MKKQKQFFLASILSILFGFSSLFGISKVEAANTVIQLTSLPDPATNTESITQPLVVGDHLFFGRTRQDISQPLASTLYVTNITPSSEQKIGDIDGIASFFVFQGKTYFVNHVYSTLTFSGNHRICEVLPTNQFLCDAEFVGSAKRGLFQGPFELGTSAYFLVSGELQDTVLYHFDPASLALQEVTRIPHGTTTTDLIQQPQVLGQHLIFKATTDQYGQELWISDGTAANTHLLKDINPGASDNLPLNSGILPFGVFQNRYYFVANDGVHGAELWSTDGTAADTHMVADINPAGDGIKDIGGMTILNDRMFFLGNDNVHGQELWSSNGTAVGTSMVADIVPGTDSWHIGPMVVLNDTLFFRADSPTVGSELWRTKGTAASTQLTADVHPGSASSDIQQLTAIDGRLYFSANDGVHGYEPWISDGTEAGTKLLQDVSLTDAFISGIPVGYFTLFEGQIVFAEKGQLWAYNPNVGTDSYIDASSPVVLPPNRVTNLKIAYGNRAKNPASDVRLRVKLDPALTYIGNTEALTPRIDGDTLEWDISSLPADWVHALTLQVRTTSIPLGQHLTVTAEIIGSANEVDTADNAATIDVLVAAQVYVPLASNN